VGATAQAQQYGRQMPVACSAEERCERTCARRDAVEFVEVPAPVVHCHGGGVQTQICEKSQLATVEVEVVKGNGHRISTPRGEVELAKAKPAVARLPALIHAPALDGVDPATDECLVSLGHEIEEWSVHDFRRGQEAVVRAVVDRAKGREPVEDESSAYGLPREGIEGDGTVWTRPAAPAEA